ncbi:MAG: hypothetical protein IGNPGNKH_00865 [Sodalis sp. Ffu]|nr:MAG: hypothetical protein IGNPGNKH_00865 [Sodalis sp. Ffu]
MNSVRYLWFMVDLGNRNYLIHFAIVAVNIGIIFLIFNTVNNYHLLYYFKILVIDQIEDVGIAVVGPCGLM